MVYQASFFCSGVCWGLFQERFLGLSAGIKQLKTVVVRRSPVGEPAKSLFTALATAKNLIKRVWECHC